MKNQRIDLPVLCRVPNMNTDLTLKLSHTGITMIKTGRYKKRYTGSSGGGPQIDINGKYYDTAAEFKRYQAAEAAARDADKKKPGRISAKLPGKITDLPSVDPESTNKGTNVPLAAKKKHYTVNKTEVTNRIQTMCNALAANRVKNPFLGMLTVSFPPCVTEDIAFQALNTWLTALRIKTSKQIREYLRISERQKIGTIHFHILIVSRVNIVKVNRAMRVTLCNLVRSGVIDYPLSAMKRYNGVDLAKNKVTRAITNFAEPRSRKALISYITKYVTKNDESFGHTAWHCSRGFSSLFTAVTCTYAEMIRKDFGLYAHENPVIDNEWFMFFPWSKDTGPPGEFVQHLAQLNGYVLSCRGLLN